MGLCGMSGRRATVIKFPKKTSEEKTEEEQKQESIENMRAMYNQMKGKVDESV